MFGYITANLSELTPEEKTRYTQVYCGICAAIGRQEGQLSRLGLQYDMAFLALAFTSRRRKEASGGASCIRERAGAGRTAGSSDTPRI